MNFEESKAVPVLARDRFGHRRKRLVVLALEIETIGHDGDDAFPALVITNQTIADWRQPFCVVSEQHMDYILRVSEDWYNLRRGHSGRDHLPPLRDEQEATAVDLKKYKVVCHTELGGHLKSYLTAA